MTNVFILTLTILVVGFSLSVLSYYVYSQKAQIIESTYLKKELAFAPLYFCSIILLVLTYFLSPIENDFIHDFQATELFVPILLSGICYTICFFPKISRFLDIALIVSVAVSCLFLPHDFLLFKGNLPLWADRLSIIALWSIFSCFYYILNGVDGILPLFNSSIFVVLMILSLFDAAPIFYGLSALSLLTVNISFLNLNWFPARLSLTNNSCKIFGFLIGGIIIFASTENLAPCFSIILSIFVLELLQSFVKKMTLYTRYTDLTDNTIYYQANISGLTAKQICFYIFKIQILFIILASFQAYLPNDFSLPIASLLLAAWFLNKLKQWNTPRQSIKEINQEFIDNIRQNINDFKDTINRD